MLDKKMKDQPKMNVVHYPKNTMTLPYQLTKNSLSSLPKPTPITHKDSS